MNAVTAVAVVVDLLVKTCKLISRNYDLWPAAIRQQVTLKEPKRGSERARRESESELDKHQVKCQRVAECGQIIEQLIKHDILEEEKKANHNNSNNKMEICFFFSVFLLIEY